MNRFELFCMIFYALDAIWDETQDEELGNYLSSANPFMFEDIGSAVPEVFDTFCSYVDSDVKLEDSHSVAKNYVKSLNNESVSKAFDQIDKDAWDEGVAEYMASDHKGMEAK